MTQPDPDRLLHRLLAAAADKVAQAQARLSALDAAIGDGDHGAAMAKVAAAITTCLDQHPQAEPKTLLEAMAWAVMDTDAGSTGPLYGSLLMGMAESAGLPLDAARLADMMENGSRQLLAYSGAQVGDKTLVDALVPAVQALRRAADAGRPLPDALADAAHAADQGARATAAMTAARGRARHLGPRAVGHVDPGACSLALFFQGMSEALDHA